MGRHCGADALRRNRRSQQLFVGQPSLLHAAGSGRSERRHRALHAVRLHGNDERGGKKNAGKKRTREGGLLGRDHSQTTLSASRSRTLSLSRSLAFALPGAYRMRTQNRQVVIPTARPGPGVMGAPGSLGMMPPSLGGASALPTASSSVVGDVGRGHNGHALQRSSGSGSAARKSSKSSHRRDDVRSFAVHTHAQRSGPSSALTWAR